MAKADSTVTYRDVPGFPGYRVGDDGSVWSQWRSCRWGRVRKERWRQLKTPPGTKGYLRVNLAPPDGKLRQFRVHRLILESFVGPCPDGLQCRHLNGIRTDNSLANLCWGTPDDNHEDRRKHKNYSPRIKLFTHHGRTMPLKDWARELGIEYNCLWQRIFTLGMSFEEAVSRPYLGTASNGRHWTTLKKLKSSLNE